MQRITVKDIAEEVGVSISTVSKALSNKTGVSERTKKKIIRTANNMGYRVNRIAQGLARHPITIGIVMPEIWQEYYGDFKIGIKNELENLKDYNIRAEYKTISNFYNQNEYIKSLDYFLKEKVDGIILSPAFVTDYGKLLDKLYSNNIPVVLLGTDLSNSKRLTCVRVNANLAGKMAAEFMRWIIPEDKSAAVFIGNKDMKEHDEKTNGFLSEVERFSYPIEGVFETQDEPEIAYHLVKKLINERNIGGIYVATGNSIAICKCLIDLGMDKKIKVISTDIFPEIGKFIKNDIIQGVIFQNPIKQGKISLKILYEYIVKKDTPKENIFIKPQLVLRNDFHTYLYS